MMNRIIRFIERDVDGCEIGVEVTVLLKTDMVLTGEHKRQLERAIEDIRNEWEDEEWDNDSVVEEVFTEVFTRVFGTDVKMEIIIPDIEVEF